MPMARSQGSLGADVADLRRVFALLPWSMTGRIVFLVASGALAALLDMVAVVAMLPLTQMLTSEGAVPPLVQRFLVPIVGTEDRPTLLLATALFVGLAFMLKNVALIVIRWWSLGITARASAELQSRMLDLYVRAPYAAHRRRSRSTILQTVMNSAPNSLMAVLLGYITVVVNALTIVLLLGTMLVLSPLACLAALIIFGGSALLIAQVLKPAALRYARRSLDLETQAWSQVNPAIEGFRESRIFGRESLFVSQFAQNRRRVAKNKQPQSLLGELPKYLLEIVMVVGILVVALLLFATQPASVASGLLAVFAAASIRIIPSLNLVVATFNGVRAGRPQLRLVAEQLEELEADARASRSRGEERVEVPRADIVVDRLGFTYSDARTPVLDDVTVTIPAGSTVALVGASGAGKTTFADILAGLFEATEGSVTVGGIDIAEHPRSWREQVAMVSQRVYLWEASVRDLITFGLPAEDVDDELLADVVRRARLTDFVAALPEGLDTVIGDSGARVSGGQAQRIGIARALFAQPSVLILDEATSALDNETEHEITATIEAMHGDLTVIVIAHRLSTVKNADEILFFADGRLRSRGTMSQLRSIDPEFDRLVELGSLTAD